MGSSKWFTGTGSYGIWSAVAGDQAAVSGYLPGISAVRSRASLYFADGREPLKVKECQSHAHLLQFLLYFLSHTNMGDASEGKHGKELVTSLLLSK